MSIDLLAIGAHPDDVELTIGGTIAKMTAAGRSVVLLDLTRGEMGTRGSGELRTAEAAAAAKALGVADRLCMDLPDGNVQADRPAQTRLIEIIRKLRPKLVMAHFRDDLHPDHAACGRLVESAMYPSGFARFPAEGTAYRPHEYLFFMSHYPFTPSFIVDVTDHWQTKLKAIHCYASQLHKPDSNEPVTGISQADFLRRIEARAIYFGSLIQRPYGEPFVSLRALPMADPVAHYEPFPRI